MKGRPKRGHWPMWLQHTLTFATIGVVGAVIVFVGLPLTGLAAHNLWNLFMAGWELAK